MKVASLADVKARLSAYIEELPREGPVVITRNGKAAAVLIAPEDDQDLEHLLLARAPQFQAMLNRSRKSIQEGRGLSHDELWERVKSRKRKNSPNSQGRRKAEHTGRTTVLRKRAKEK